MAQPRTFEQSREIPIDVQKAFDGTLPMPLPTLFARRYGPIPPINKVLDQTGDWDAVGQTRTVKLTGGGSMREELTHVDPPHAFGYVLSQIKGPLSPLVSSISRSPGLTGPSSRVRSATFCFFFRVLSNRRSCQGRGLSGGVGL